MTSEVLMTSEVVFAILWYFAVYSVLGWCVEVVYCTVKSGQIRNRGFLNGPVCPVYGFGMLAVCGVSDRLPLEKAGQASFLVLFFTGMLLASAVEYIAGWLLYHLFHARWWDYSERPLNLGGYICLQMSLLWGLGTVIMINFVHPIVQQLSFVSYPESSLAARLGYPLLAVFYLVFAADIVVTVSIVAGLNKRLTELDEIRASMRVLSDAMSEKLGTDALKAEQRIDENRVQAALARAEIRDLAEENRRENQKKLEAKLEEIRQRRAELRTKLTSGAVFGPRRLMRAFPSAIHRDHEALWRLLSDEVNDDLH